MDTNTKEKHFARMAAHANMKAELRTEIMRLVKETGTTSATMAEALGIGTEWMERTYANEGRALTVETISDMASVMGFRLEWKFTLASR